MPLGRICLFCQVLHRTIRGFCFSSGDEPGVSKELAGLPLAVRCTVVLGKYSRSQSPDTGFCGIRNLLEAARIEGMAICPCQHPHYSNLGCVSH